MSSCHISLQVIVYKGADYLNSQTGKRKLPALNDDDGGNKILVMRGQVAELTKKSRLRLMRELSKVRKDAVPLFVTLKYPATYPEDSET